MKFPPLELPSNRWEIYRVAFDGSFHVQIKGNLSKECLLEIQRLVDGMNSKIDVGAVYEHKATGDRYYVLADFSARDFVHAKRARSLINTSFVALMDAKTEEIGMLEKELLLINFREIPQSFVPGRIAGNVWHKTKRKQ